LTREGRLYRDEKKTVFNFPSYLFLKMYIHEYNINENEGLEMMMKKAP